MIPNNNKSHEPRSSVVPSSPSWSLGVSLCPPQVQRCSGVSQGLAAAAGEAELHQIPEHLSLPPHYPCLQHGLCLCLLTWYMGDATGLVHWGPSSKGRRGCALLEDLDTLKYGCRLIFTFLVAWAVEDNPSVFIPSSWKHPPRLLVTILSTLFSSKCPERVELNFHQQQLIYSGNKEGKEPAVPAWCACVAVMGRPGLREPSRHRMQWRVPCPVLVLETAVQVWDIIVLGAVVEAFGKVPSRTRESSSSLIYDSLPHQNSAEGQDSFFFKVILNRRGVERDFGLSHHIDLNS